MLLELTSAYLNSMTEDQLLRAVTRDTCLCKLSFIPRAINNWTVEGASVEDVVEHLGSWPQCSNLRHISKKRVPTERLLDDLTGFGIKLEELET